MQDITHTCWDALVQWFFQYRTNNFYTNAFYEIMDLTFRIADDHVIATILSKLLLLPKMYQNMSEICPNGVMEPELQSQSFVYNVKRICCSLASAISVRLIS